MSGLVGRIAAAISIVACASGCLSEIEGPDSTLTTRGPHRPTSTIVAGGGDACEVKYIRRDQVSLFEVAYYCAWSKAYAEIKAGGTSDSSQAASSQAAYRMMLREGLGVVRGNCSDFFRSRGDRQQSINFVRDAVAIGGTTAGAIVGLTGGSVLAMSIIALSGATLYGGLDVYTKNFLFGVENIEAVRTLTMETLSANASKLVASTDQWSFQGAADAIAENQEICKPASIAAAVRLKLRGGSGGIEAAGENGLARNQFDMARIAIITSKLGVGSGFVIDETRLAAACWAATVDGMQYQTYIGQKLLPNPPFPKGPAVPTEWPAAAAQIAGECASLSTVTQNAIKTKIAELREAAAADPSASAKALLMPPLPRLPGSVPAVPGLQPFVRMTVP